MLRVVIWGILAAVVGCGGTSSAPTAPLAGPVTPADSSGHSHEKGKMLIADFGPHHALLTAHLSKTGHELDLFVESAGKDPKRTGALCAAQRFDLQQHTGHSSGHGEQLEVPLVEAARVERHGIQCRDDARIRRRHIDAQQSAIGRGRH